MKPANDSRLDALLDAGLASLPRERASDRFTERVLDEVQKDPGRSPWRSLAAALALLAVGLGVHGWSEAQEQREAVERIAALRAEYEVLQEELAGLEAKRNQGVVYLGGNEDVEFVIDLRRLLQQRAAQQHSAQQQKAATASGGGSGDVRPAVAQAL